MAIDVTNVPHGSSQPGNVEGKILNGPPGGAHIHKVGSAKQYATKSVVGRVYNQAKFPMSTRKAEPMRKKG